MSLKPQTQHWPHAVSSSNGNTDDSALNPKWSKYFKMLTPWKETHEDLILGHRKSLSIVSYKNTGSESF